MQPRPPHRASDIEDIRTRPSDFGAFPRPPFPRAREPESDRPSGRFSRGADFSALFAVILLTLIVLFAFDIVGG